jgi:RNA polymerase sigma-70 factor (ECF subfamily)
VLFHLCDVPIEQIAADTGAPVGTVKARLARGRAALAGLLEDHPENPNTSEGSHV